MTTLSVSGAHPRISGQLNSSGLRIVVATTTGFHLRHLARELIRLGHDVRYLTYLPKFRITRDGITKGNASSYFLRLQPWSTGALIRYTPAVQKYCTEVMLERTDDAIAEDVPPCDVFIGLSSMAVKSAEVARRKYGAKIIIDRGARHVLSQSKLVSQDGGEPLTEFYIKRELASYAVADYIALPSHHAVESFKDYGFSQNMLFQNPYGVDLSTFVPMPFTGKPFKLLFVGGWSYRKGVDILTKALEQLNDCSLTHAGMRVDVDYPTTDRFSALGHCNHAMLARIYASHQILVLPSREDGFGMVLLEALASGLGIVASCKTGGHDIKEVIGKKEFVSLVDPGNVEALVAGVRSMIEIVAKQATDRVILSIDDKKYFSWAAYARRYADFLSSIL
jgi:glycosyltransferase involved in cell wall biosynthesis